MTFPPRHLDDRPMLALVSVSREKAPLTRMAAAALVATWSGHGTHGGLGPAKVVFRPTIDDVPPDDVRGLAALANRRGVRLSLWRGHDGALAGHDAVGGSGRVSPLEKGETAC